MYSSGIDRMPSLDLDGVFWMGFDDYPEDFRRYWGLDSKHAPEHLDPDDWDRYRRLDEVARRIAALATSLARPPKLPDEVLATPKRLDEGVARGRARMNELIDKVSSGNPDLIRILSSFPTLRPPEERDRRFFYAALQLHLAGFVVWPRSLAEKVTTLTGFAVRVDSHRAREFLGRVSRCYLYGMDAELAVMARASLEAVLEERLDEQEVRKMRRIPKHLRVGLADLIAVADGTILSTEGAAAARKLKQVGDEAVHVSSQMAAKPEETLANLTVVLTDISQH